MKTLIIISQIIFVMSCSSQNDSFDVIKSKKLAIYVEARNAKDGLGSGSFGDIQIMDLNSQKIKQITKDRYYDKSPHFISAGTEILFQSNRFADASTLAIQGIEGPYDECIYSLLTDSIKLLNIVHQSERPKYLRNSLEDLQSYPLTHSYLFHYVSKGNIYITDSLTNNALPFIDLSEFGKIWQFRFSPNKENIVFRCQPKEETYDGEFLGIINLTDKKYIKLREKASIESWSVDGERLVFSVEDTVFVYNVKDKTTTRLFVSPQNIIINNCHLIGENEVVFLGREKKLIEQMGYQVLASTISEIYIFKINENKLLQLTNNGLDKSDLEVYLRN